MKSCMEKRSDKPFPGATTYFYMWSSVEGTVLQTWSNYLLSKQPTHLSLHFDGVRINADLVEDVEALLSACQEKIKEATGFNVQIRQKIYQHFLESLACLDVTDLNDVPAELQKSPNCVPCALWHLAAAGDKANLLQAFLQIDTQQNAYAAERSYRTYQQCAEICNTVDLKPSTGMAWDRRASICCTPLVELLGICKSGILLPEGGTEGPRCTHLQQRYGEGAYWHV